MKPLQKLLVAVTLAGVFLLPAFAVAQQKVGLVTAMKGNAEFKSPGSQTWKSLSLKGPQVVHDPAVRPEMERLAYIPYRRGISVRSIEFHEEIQYLSLPIREP